MSAPTDPRPADAQAAPGPPIEDRPAPDGEQIDALPVLVPQARVLAARPLTGALSGESRASGVMIPAVQAAAVAAGGFVAGAAVVGLVHRRQRRSTALAKGRRFGAELGRGGGRARKGSRAGELVQIVGSRSLLLDVHLLGGSGADG
jgi:hypothetical protein